MGLAIGMGVRSAVLACMRKRASRGTKRDGPDDFVALPEPERAEIDVFEKFGDGHEIDETVTLFAGKGLVAETLGEQEMGYESGWVRFDDGKDENGEEDVPGDG